MAAHTTYVLATVSVGALLFRRSYPVAVALVCGATFTWLDALDHQGELLNLPVAVALFGVAVSGYRRRTIVAGVVAASWFGTFGVRARQWIS